MTTVNAKSATAISAPKASKKPSNKANAKKGNARDLQKVVLEARQDKVTATRLVGIFRNDVAGTIYSNWESDAEKKAAIKQSAENAKAQLAAAIDRDMQRALTLVSVPRGTTGKGGLHHSDVVTELFASMKKKQAVENNTKALQSAGLI